MCLQYRPVSPEAAPPRCGLLVDATSETCVRDRGHLGDCFWTEPGWRSDNEHDAEAAPPSRESGALLDDYALWCKQVGASLGCSGEEQRKSARAALDRHLSTIERDAARMREENALLRNVEAAARRLPRATPRGGGAGTLHAFTITAGGVWANDIALTTLDEYRAALTPSGEDK